MVALLNIRFKQFFRMLADLGFIRSLIGLLLLVFFCFILISAIPEWSWIITGVAALMLLGLHTSRADKTFLWVSGLPAPWIFRVEYLLMSCLLIVPFLMRGRWQEALALFTFGLILPEINIPARYSSSTFRHLIAWIPTDMFEWRSGMRKNYFPVLLVLVLAILFSRLTAAIPVALLLFSLITTGFYIETEPREMLEVFQLSPKKLLLFKLKKHLALFWLMSSPLLVLFLIFHVRYWYVLVFVIAAASLIQTISIFLKYALYEPHEALQGNTIIIALSTLFTVIPLFIPIPFFWVVRYYRKASSNLQFYLHDFI